MSKGTHNRNVRVNDELWEAAREKARDDGITISEVIRQALKDYTKGGSEQ